MGKKKKGTQAKATTEDTSVVTSSKFAGLPSETTTAAESESQFSQSQVSQSIRKVKITTIKKSSIPRKDNESGLIVAGKYAYDQENFWKGRIPGVQQTYPFPRSKPIIFHNQWVGMPQKFGPYAKYTKGPPSPPPPTPASRDVFPDPPSCFCHTNKHLIRHGGGKPNAKPPFHIYTTDPYADLRPDRQGFDWCTGLKYRISPQFRFKKFQRRFVFIMMFSITMSYVPPMLVLFCYFYWSTLHQYIIELAICDEVNTALIVNVTSAAVYMILTWFLGKARHYPRPCIAVITRICVIITVSFASAILSEQMWIKFEAEETGIDLTEFCNKTIEITNTTLRQQDREVSESLKLIYMFLDIPRSVGYWPALAFFYEAVFRTTIAFVTRWTKIHYYDFKMKVILYNVLWLIFCFQGIMVYLDTGADFLFVGPTAWDAVQANLAMALAAWSTVNSVRNLHKLFAGRLCALTEREYLYCLLRMAN